MDKDNIVVAGLVRVVELDEPIESVCRDGIRQPSVQPRAQSIGCRQCVDLCRAELFGLPSGQGAMQLSKGATQVVRQPHGLRQGGKVPLASFAADLRSGNDGAHLQVRAVVLHGREAERNPGAE
jgi:hypothetical protein